MSKAPAFQFYPGDFLSDSNVALMSGDEVGAYVLLLCHCWLEGALPTDIGDLARLARVPARSFAKSWEKRISKCFEMHKDGWRHPRLEVEREKQAAHREKQRNAAESRWRKDAAALPAHASGMPPGSAGEGAVAMPSACSSSSSSSSSSEKEESMSGSPPDALSPGRRAKAEAESYAEWFNRRFGRSFTANPGVVKLVKALLAAGYTQREMRMVALVCRDKWQGDERMREHLVPDTLLRLAKFGSRLDEAREKYGDAGTQREEAGDEGEMQLRLVGDAGRGRAAVDGPALGAARRPAGAGAVSLGGGLLSTVLSRMAGGDG